MNAKSDGLETFRQGFASLAAIGREEATGGLNRLAWTAADAEAGIWFHAQAEALGLECERDANGNRWAWWWPDARRPDALHEGDVVAVGSHLDTVPDGGAYDGALGVVSAFAAVAALAAAGVRPARPVAIVAWADEEGARFNTPCFGSGLSAGRLHPAGVLERRDAAGVVLAEALESAGVDPAGLGPDPKRLRAVVAFIELHIEQGRGLVFHDKPVGVGVGIWPHGRWRIRLRGETNHAGTTRMHERRDPMYALAELVEATRNEAVRRGAVATVGRVGVHPNGPNAVPGKVTAWLDARAPDDRSLDGVVSAIRQRVDRAALQAGVDADVVEESSTPGVEFDEGLRARIDSALGAGGFRAPALLTAAGHDAGALAPQLPTGMLYVRNREGVSHSPAEYADEADCADGVHALTLVLRELVT